MAKIETMACRLVFGRYGSDAGRTAGLARSGRWVPLSTSVFHIVTSGWPGPDGTVWVPGELARRREHGFTDTHNRLSSCCQSVVWFLTQRPGAVPGLVTGYLPEADADCRKARESVSNPGRKSAIGRTVRTLGCSRPSTGRVSTTLEKGLFRLNSLILNGLTQLDDFRTRSGKNREYGPNRE